MNGVKLQTGVGGFYKIEAAKRYRSGREMPGSRRVLADWWPNLITDFGLNYMGANSGYLNWIRVGTGSSTPSVNDTQLGNQVAGTNNDISSTFGGTSSSPFYARRTRTHRFNEGQAAGNLSEVGVGPSQSGSDLYSRSLILDGSGNPTTIPVASDEFLDVTYEQRIYVPEVDIEGAVDIGGVMYDYIGRAAGANVRTSSTASSSTENAWYMHDAGSPAGALRIWGHGRVFTGDIGPINGEPSGTSVATSDTGAAAAYSNNSFQRGYHLNLGLLQGNIGGIRSLRMRFGWGCWQIGFYRQSNGDPIPKNDTNILTLSFYHSWGRRAS